MPDTEELQRRRAILVARLERLDRQIHEIEAELDSHDSRDWEELATEREGDEVLERRGTSAQAEMVAIRAALGRLDEGEYGYCTRCGTEIASERLDLLPHTPFCAACAADLSG